MDKTTESGQTSLHEDEEDGVALVIPLEFDDLREGQLGARVYSNPEGDAATEPRSLITAAELKDKYYCQIRFRRARYGKYKDEDGILHENACLIVLNVTFSQRSSFRYKSAEITVEFEDPINLGWNPHSGKIDTTYRPRVLTLEPQLFEGPVSQARGTYTAKVQAGITAPVIPVGFNAEFGGSQETSWPGQFKIHGVVEEDPPSLIHWTIREDKVKKTGVRPELSLAMIVSYTPNRKFAAKVRLNADVYLPLLRPVCGVKDDPVFFDPDYMQRKQSGAHAPGQGTQPSVPGVIQDDLNSEDLRKLTRLSGEFGAFQS